MTPEQICEGLMMLAFGASWPMQIIKTIRTKNPTGKSFIFMWLILLGYVAGLCSQAFEGHFFTDPVTILYVLNTLMVATDLILSTRYLMLLKKQQKSV